jgi:large subunit ribosomal protein L24
MKIRRGDTVVVLSGNDRGKTGRVLRVDASSQRLVVEGVRLMKRHARPTQRNPKGGIVEREGTIHLSNVALYRDGQKVKVGFVWREGDGKKSKFRIDRRSGEPV